MRGSFKSDKERAEFYYTKSQDLIEGQKSTGVDERLQELASRFASSEFLQNRVFGDIPNESVIPVIHKMSVAEEINASRAVTSQQKSDLKNILTLDYAKTDDGSSVIGPAAYFFDLLRVVLSQVDVTSDEKDIAQIYSFIARRPDLLDIPLDGKHATELLIPNILIVNYILARHLIATNEHADQKDVVSQVADLEGSSSYRQLISAYEKKAFELIRRKGNDIHWPFDLNFERQSAYLKAIGTNTYEVNKAIAEISLLGNGEPLFGEQLKLNYLNINEPELFQLEGGEYSNNNLSKVFPTAESGDGFGISISTQDFCSVMQITYSQFDELLRLSHSSHAIRQYLPEQKNYFINGCGKDEYALKIRLNRPELVEELLNLDKWRASKIGIFINLAKKTGWSYDELEVVLAILNIKGDRNKQSCAQVNRSELAKIADIKRFQDQFNLSIIDVAHLLVNGEHPLFSRVIDNIDKSELDNEFWQLHKQLLPLYLQVLIPQGGEQSTKEAVDKTDVMGASAQESEAIQIKGEDLTVAEKAEAKCIAVIDSAIFVLEGLKSESRFGKQIDVVITHLKKGNTENRITYYMHYANNVLIQLSRITGVSQSELANLAYCRAFENCPNYTDQDNGVGYHDLIKRKCISDIDFLNSLGILKKIFNKDLVCIYKLMGLVFNVRTTEGGLSQFSAPKLRVMLADNSPHSIIENIFALKGQNDLIAERGWDIETLSYVRLGLSNGKQSSEVRRIVNQIIQQPYFRELASLEREQWNLKLSDASFLNSIEVKLAKIFGVNESVLRRLVTSLDAKQVYSKQEPKFDKKLESLAVEARYYTFLLRTDLCVGDENSTIETYRDIKEKAAAMLHSLIAMVKHFNLQDSSSYVDRRQRMDGVIKQLFELNQALEVDQKKLISKLENRLIKLEKHKSDHPSMLPADIISLKGHDIKSLLSKDVLISLSTNDLGLKEGMALYDELYSIYVAIYSSMKKDVNADVEEPSSDSAGQKSNEVKQTSDLLNHAMFSVVSDDINHFIGIMQGEKATEKGSDFIKFMSGFFSGYNKHLPLNSQQKEFDKWKEFVNNGTSRCISKYLNILIAMLGDIIISHQINQLLSLKLAYNQSLKVKEDQHKHALHDTNHALREQLGLEITISKDLASSIAGQQIEEFKIKKINEDNEKNILAAQSTIQKIADAVSKLSRQTFYAPPVEDIAINVDDGHAIPVTLFDGPNAAAENSAEVPDQNGDIHSAEAVVTLDQQANVSEADGVDYSEPDFGLYNFYDDVRDMHRTYDSRYKGYVQDYQQQRQRHMPKNLVEDMMNSLHSDAIFKKHWQTSFLLQATELCCQELTVDLSNMSHFLQHVLGLAKDGNYQAVNKIDIESSVDDYGITLDQIKSRISVFMDSITNTLKLTNENPDVANTTAELTEAFLQHRDWNASDINSGHSNVLKPDAFRHGLARLEFLQSLPGMMMSKLDESIAAMEETYSCAKSFVDKYDHMIQVCHANAKKRKISPQNLQNQIARLAQRKEIAENLLTKVELSKNNLMQAKASLATMQAQAQRLIGIYKTSIGSVISQCQHISEQSNRKVLAEKTRKTFAAILQPTAEAMGNQRRLLQKLDDIKQQFGDIDQQYCSQYMQLQKDIKDTNEVFGVNNTEGDHYFAGLIPKRFDDSREQIISSEVIQAVKAVINNNLKYLQIISGDQHIAKSDEFKNLYQTVHGLIKSIINIDFELGEFVIEDFDALNDEVTQRQLTRQQAIEVVTKREQLQYSNNLLKEQSLMSQLHQHLDYFDKQRGNLCLIIKSAVAVQSLEDENIGDIDIFSQLLDEHLNKIEEEDVSEQKAILEKAEKKLDALKLRVDEATSVLKKIEAKEQIFQDDQYRKLKEMIAVKQDIARFDRIKEKIDQYSVDIDHYNKLLSKATHEKEEMLIPEKKQSEQEKSGASSSKSKKKSLNPIAWIKNLLAGSKKQIDSQLQGHMERLKNMMEAYEALLPLSEEVFVVKKIITKVWQCATDTNLKTLERKDIEKQIAELTEELEEKKMELAEASQSSDNISVALTADENSSVVVSDKPENADEQASDQQNIATIESDIQEKSVALEALKAGLVTIKKTIEANHNAIIKGGDKYNKSKGKLIPKVQNAQQKYREMFADHEKNNQFYGILGLLINQFQQTSYESDDQEQESFIQVVTQFEKVMDGLQVHVEKNITDFQQYSDNTANIEYYRQLAAYKQNQKNMQSKIDKYELAIGRLKANKDKYDEIFSNIKSKEALESKLLKMGSVGETKDMQLENVSGEKKECLAIINSPELANAQVAYSNALASVDLAELFSVVVSSNLVEDLLAYQNFKRELGDDASNLLKCYYVRNEYKDVFIAQKLDISIPTWKALKKHFSIVVTDERMSTNISYLSKLLKLRELLQLFSGNGELIITLSRKAKDNLLSPSEEKYDLLPSLLQEVLKLKDMKAYDLAVRKIAERQRNVLVKQVLLSFHRDESLKSLGIQTVAELSQYFLKDLEINGDDTISPIVDGHLALQWYLTRCRNGVESEKYGITVRHAIPKTWWSWIANYRVWEVNRRVFLYPENYLDPGLRNDKSDIFQDLQKKISKAQLNDDLLERSYLTYLANFSELTDLEFCSCTAMTLENGRGRIYIVAATKTTPKQLFYRTVDSDLFSKEKQVSRESNYKLFEHGQTAYYCSSYDDIFNQLDDSAIADTRCYNWTFWKKIPLTFGDAKNISAIWAHNRLYIYWQDYKSTSSIGVSGMKPTNDTTHTTTLHCSYMMSDGSWQAPQDILKGKCHVPFCNQTAIAFSQDNVDELIRRDGRFTRNMNSDGHTFEMRFVNYEQELIRYLNLDVVNSHLVSDEVLRLTAGLERAANASKKLTDIFKNDLQVGLQDLRYDDAWGGYYWELMYFVPIIIANQLVATGQFSEAMNWYSCVFDQSLLGKSQGEAREQTAFRFAPLTKRTGADVLLPLMNPEQLTNFHDYAFRAHDMAKLRNGLPYKKYTVMTWVRCYLAWADYLFTQNTRESINRATGLYMTANDLLGPTPRGLHTATYQEADYHQTAHALFEINFKHGAKEVMVRQREEPLVLFPYNYTQASYFHVPENREFMGLWDHVSDRLYKIRYCLSIQGIKQQLALLSPQIDPHQLVRAVAARGGEFVQDMLGQLGGQKHSHYRFGTLLAKAKEFAAFVERLGAALNSALEHEDADELTRITNEYRQLVLEQTTAIKKLDIQSAKENQKLLNIREQSIHTRLSYYEQQLANGGVLPSELAADNLLDVAAGLSDTISTIRSAAELAGVAPEVGSPFAMVYGGRELRHAALSSAPIVNGMISRLNHMATKHMTNAGRTRRSREWQLQQRLVKQEEQGLKYEKKVADFRLQVVQLSLIEHMYAMQHQEKIGDYYRSKFTNADLYQWMTTQLYQLYNEAYQLAVSMANKAAQAFEYEIGASPDLTTAGFWSNSRKGLLAGQRLTNALHQMEASYLESHQRFQEITKTISLRELLRNRDGEQVLATANAADLTWSTAIDSLKDGKGIPFKLVKSMFDNDFDVNDGSIRRIKMMRVNVSGLTGPSQQINLKLFHLQSGAHICISDGMSGTGMFQANFNSPRYLPFEGVSLDDSSWALQIGSKTATDKMKEMYSSIYDVEIKVFYVIQPAPSTTISLN